MDMAAQSAGRVTVASKEQVSDVHFSPWVTSPAKRLFDLFMSTSLIVATLPLMIVAAAAIKLSSAGPVLFRQSRCGRGGRIFEFLKFRTMYHSSEPQRGCGLTRTGDSRVTAVGRVLRKWKVDELPQLLNVVRGDMSLVGPRPDLPKYIAQVGKPQRPVLWLMPGVTGPASLKFHHEEEVIATFPPDRMEECYVDKLLPEKLAMELEYARQATLVSDVMLLLRTATTVLSSFKR